MADNRKQLIVDEVEAMKHLRTKTPGSDLWSRSARMTRSLRGPGPLPAVPEQSLYQSHNVTGSTGSGRSASVYYRSGDTFSHVTTQHEHADNIGRSRARTFADYHIGNTGSEGQSQEFYGGKVKHTSRNPYKSVQSSSEQSRLHTAASKFPNLKDKY